MSENEGAVSASASPSTDTGDNSPVDNSQGDASDQVNEKPQIPKPKKPVIKKYKIGDEEVSLSDDDIIKNYQKWKGSDKAFREAAEARKNVDRFYQDLQENPEKILNDPKIPIDKRKLAEKWLLESIEQEMNPTDPRDARMKALEDKISEYESKEKSKAEEEQERQYSESKEKRKGELSKVFSDAMSMTQLSKHPESAASTLREMALYMRICKERGEEVTAEDLVDHIHNSRFNQFYMLAQQFDGDELIEYLGEDIVKKIRKSDLARLRASRGVPQDENITQQHRSDVGTKSKAPKRFDAYEAREMANKLFG